MRLADVAVRARQAPRDDGDAEMRCATPAASAAGH